MAANLSSPRGYVPDRNSANPHRNGSSEFVKIGITIAALSRRGDAVADLEQMKQKYASVLNAVQQQQVSLSHVNLQDNRLFIQGLAPSEEAKNRVWDEIKKVNPNWSMELIADISVDPNAKPATAAAGASAGGGRQNPEQTYTVMAGDSLSAISKKFYGDANQYMKIFEANRDVLSDPDRTRPGQKLRIPA